MHLISGDFRWILTTYKKSMHLFWISGAFHRFSVLYAELQCSAVHIAHCDTNCALHDARCLAVQLHTADCKASQLHFCATENLVTFDHICITFCITIVAFVAGALFRSVLMVTGEKWQRLPPLASKWTWTGYNWNTNTKYKYEIAFKKIKFRPPRPLTDGFRD